MAAAQRVSRRRTLTLGAILWGALFASRAESQDWLRRLPLESGRATIELGNPPVVTFLGFGGHSYAPDEVRAADGVDLDPLIEREKVTSIAPFQGLTATTWRFPASFRGQRVDFIKRQSRDYFWDQVLTVDLKHVHELPAWQSVESGTFGESLPAAVLNQSRTQEETQRERESLVDPVIPDRVDHEVTWNDLESAAYPLDFQKVLLASRNDANPAFAYQNGQWFTTWLSRDLPKWTKEDHWFAPALLVGKQLVRPAPLAAKTEFETTDDGVILPLWKLQWRFGDATVTQSLYSHCHASAAAPATYGQFQLENAPAGARLAVGLGRRPNSHYWDEKSRERSPVPFFTLSPQYRRDGSTILDAGGTVILDSAQDFTLNPCGPVEMLATFEADSTGCVYIRTPQTESKSAAAPFDRQQFDAARQDFLQGWSRELRTGARAKLPSQEWMGRIDIWQSQVSSITRVHYDGRERLSYGAGFYQYYFGPEEGWPIVALARWGRGDEAKRQAEIMLSAENRDKSNVHHQSRNGTAGWYAAEVARVTGDRAWLEKVVPALEENAEWTISARRSTAKSANPLTRGLLPAHIYGGDVRDPATSLYASLVCYKGLVETANVFRAFGTAEMKQQADHYDAEVRQFRARLTEVMNEVIDESTDPPFLPLALAIPSLDGKNEGPYERLTDSRYGNYWNLFAPSVLELGLTFDDRGRPNQLLFDYMARHGGLWAALPRFNTGLDAAYSIGVVRELQRRSLRDVRYRNQAIAALDAFFLHAASRNGYTIPEVAGLFPHRLDHTAYERLVRESPWSFGMYDDQRYLSGHISFTEPLGAAAGEALWLIRDALVCEGQDENGLPDGALYLLPNVPSEWFDQGQEIELEKFPTAYGLINVQLHSDIDGTGKIRLDYQFDETPTKALRLVRLRVAPRGFTPRAGSFPGEHQGGAMEFTFR